MRKLESDIASMKQEMERINTRLLIIKTDIQLSLVAAVIFKCYYKDLIMLEIPKEKRVEALAKKDTRAQRLASLSHQYARLAFRTLLRGGRDGGSKP